MLKAAVAGNAPPMGFSDRLGRSEAASAMDALMRSGLGREDAAKMVAKAIEGRSYAQGHSRDLWKAVARWRDDRRAPRADLNDLAVSRYRRTQELIQKISQAPNGRERLRTFASRLLNEKAMISSYPPRPS
jgi:hypothetical protein